MRHNALASFTLLSRITPLSHRLTGGSIHHLKHEFIIPQLRCAIASKAVGTHADIDYLILQQILNRHYDLHCSCNFIDIKSLESNTQSNAWPGLISSSFKQSDHSSKTTLLRCIKSKIDYNFLRKKCLAAYPGRPPYGTFQGGGFMVGGSCRCA
eukprot:scaffold551057_cov18-Prasinocladus_malaysianus.AAC.1